MKFFPAVAAAVRWRAGCLTSLSNQTHQQLLSSSRLLHHAERAAEAPCACLICWKWRRRLSLLSVQPVQIIIFLIITKQRGRRRTPLQALETNNRNKTWILSMKVVWMDFSYTEQNWMSGKKNNVAMKHHWWTQHWHKTKTQREWMGSVLECWIIWDFTLILPHHLILLFLLTGCCRRFGRSCDLEKWLLSIFLTHSPSQTERIADRREGGDTQKESDEEREKEMGMKRAVSLQEYVHSLVEMKGANVLILLSS